MTTTKLPPGDATPVVAGRDHTLTRDLDPRASTRGPRVGKTARSRGRRPAVPTRSPVRGLASAAALPGSTGRAFLRRASRHTNRGPNMPRTSSPVPGLGLACRNQTSAAATTGVVVAADP